MNATESVIDGSNATPSTSSTGILKNSRPDKLNINFDHLSVVSEECMSTSDDQIEVQQKRIQHQLDQYETKLRTLSCGTANHSPQTSAELMFSDFRSTVPPLKHFENLSYKDIGPNVGELRNVVALFQFGDR